LSAPLFDELLGQLVQAEVRFVVVGGLALGSWGVVRGTKDCDIVLVDLDDLNAAQSGED
jgi:hypothetical protein